jgi:hypothetical protein
MTFTKEFRAAIDAAQLASEFIRREYE